MDGPDGIALMQLFSNPHYLDFQLPAEELIFVHCNMKADIVAGSSIVGFLVYCYERMSPFFIDQQSYLAPADRPQLQLLGES
jgi:hypothetical protein